MTADSYSALWVSHTSISDFLTCPRAYFLKNIYRDPKTGHKIKLMFPPLALGQAVHEVIESLSTISRERRFEVSLVHRFHDAWIKVTGKKGGFFDSETEMFYKQRGEEMLENLMKDPGPLKQKAVKIKMDLPKYWISKQDNIILCGKIDWLEYIEETDSVHIIDFKTSKGEENNDSLQLPIYYLLVHNCQSKHVSNMSYWYLGRKDGLVQKTIPDPERSTKTILEIAKKIKIARQLSVFRCPHKTGCHACRPFEAVIQKEAEFVGVGSYREDIYTINSSIQNKFPQEEIL